MSDTVRLYDHVDSYELSHPIRDESAAFYRRCITTIEKWAGCELTVETISDAAVNRGLLAMERQALSPSYLRGIRAGVLAVWRDAAAEGLCGPPRRIRSVRILPRRPDVWTPDEMKLLVEAGRETPGRFRTLMYQRGPYWESLIRTAWDTGLRRRDLQRLRKSDCRPVFNWIQHKTRKPVRLRLRKSTREAIARLERADGAPLWPLWGHPNCFIQSFASVVARADISPGPFKKIRKSAGTAAETLCPGTGHYLLGNTRREFERHYMDALQFPTPQPPELEGPVGGGD